MVVTRSIQERSQPLHRGTTVQIPTNDTLGEVEWARGDTSTRAAGALGNLQEVEWETTVSRARGPGASDRQKLGLKCGRLQGRPAVRSGPGPRLSNFVCARGLRGLSLVPKHQGCQGNFPLAIADLAIAIWQLPFGNCQLGNCQLGIFPSGSPLWNIPYLETSLLV